MHTAYDRKDNTEPASITALAVSKDHRTLYVGEFISLSSQRNSDYLNIISTISQVMREVEFGVGASLNNLDGWLIIGLRTKLRLNASVVISSEFITFLIIE